MYTQFIFIFFMPGKGKNFPSSEKGQNWAMFTFLVTRTYTKTFNINLFSKVHNIYWTFHSTNVRQ